MNKEEAKLLVTHEGDYIRALERKAGELLAVLKLALPGLAHRTECMTLVPTEDWPEKGSWTTANCKCEISLVEAAIKKAEAQP